MVVIDARVLFQIALTVTIFWISYWITWVVYNFISNAVSQKRSRIVRKLSPKERESLLKKREERVNRTMNAAENNELVKGLLKHLPPEAIIVGGENNRCVGVVLNYADINYALESPKGKLKDRFKKI